MKTKTFAEIAKENGHCRCVSAYTDRGLVSPDCEIHDMEEAAEEFASQFKPKWIFTEPEKDGPYLIAYKFGVTEGKFYKGKYRTSDFGELLPEAYAHMPLPTKP